MSKSALSLYRQILKLHRHLPKDFSEVGVAYVRSEFKRHIAVTDAAVIETFMKEWRVPYKLY